MRPSDHTAAASIPNLIGSLARWLLLAHDWVGHDEFPLTQEFAAMMLGASRPTVTVVAGYCREQALSCECYRATTTLLDEVTAR